MEYLIIFFVLNFENYIVFNVLVDVVILFVLFISFLFYSYCVMVFIFGFGLWMFLDGCGEVSVCREL